MPSALIIGSGPAAAGVALALTADPAYEVTVIDVGATLEPDLQSTLQRVSTTAERSWSTSDVDRIGLQPVSTPRGALPEKRSYGSDFPFRDVGQLGGIDPLGPANGSVVSGAYGGFSNVWGAQIMPFSRATFDGWPISMADMEPHYRVALGEMTLAGDDDDLAELFPLLVPARSLPPLADRTRSSAGAVRDTPAVGPVARHHARAGTSGLQGGRVHPVWHVHDGLPLRAHLLECAHLRPPAGREPHRLPGGPARRAPGRGRRATARPGSEHVDGADRTPERRSDFRGLRGHRNDPAGARVPRDTRRGRLPAGIRAVRPPCGFRPSR